MNIIASLFNLAGPDLIVILLIVLLLFGSKKLPELARGMGQAVKEFNKAKDEIERELTRTTDVTVQPAPGQQPRQPAELPVAAPPAAIPAPAPYAAQPAPYATQPAPIAPAAQVARPPDEHLFDTGDTFQRPNPAPANQAAQPVENTHPAGQA
jgi:sec-independent protein translocase protein TatA